MYLTGIQYKSADYAGAVACLLQGVLGGPRTLPPLQAVEGCVDVSSSEAGKNLSSPMMCVGCWCRAGRVVQARSRHLDQWEAVRERCPNMARCILGGKLAHWLEVTYRPRDIISRPRDEEQGWINPQGWINSANSMIMELYVETRLDHCFYSCK